MNKILTILFLIIALAGCAKEPPFDPVKAFQDAEDDMRKENFEKARKNYQAIEEKYPDNVHASNPSHEAVEFPHL